VTLRERHQGPLAEDARREVRPRSVVTEYGWPPRMIMRVACAYTGRSRWALARAARDGALPFVGKNGRSLVFERDALDRWLVGTSDTAVAAAPARARSTSATTDALTRLRTLTGGARR
jgi:hypothetical protein